MTIRYVHSKCPRYNWIHKSKVAVNSFIANIFNLQKKITEEWVNELLQSNNNQIVVLAWKRRQNIKSVFDLLWNRLDIKQNKLFDVIKQKLNFFLFTIYRYKPWMATFSINVKTNHLRMIPNSHQLFDKVKNIQKNWRTIMTETQQVHPL